MKRPAVEGNVFDQLFGPELAGMDLETRLAHVQSMRSSRELSCQLDRTMLARLKTLEEQLGKATEFQRHLKISLDQLAAPPWFPAVYLHHYPAREGLRAVVHFGNTRRVVGLGKDIEAGSLCAGDEVFLSHELNTIVAQAPHGIPAGGETATFERRTADGRLILRHRDEQIVTHAARALEGVPLTAGDLVRCDRNAWIAFERIERPNASHLCLEETPKVTFSDVGGLNHQVEVIKRVLNLHVFHAETAREYGLRRRRSILLVGPSGTGKTMLAKALANWLATLSPAGRSRFMNIKPSALHSVWYSQSEANYREAFRVAREAAGADSAVPVVMFFDEVDSVGMARGQANAHVDDRVLTSFMAELDGLTDRGNIVVIGASNRRSSLDAALLRPGRLGDLILEIGRPKRKAALDIFAKHLPPTVPYARNGHGDDFVTTREEILQTAVSRIYAPNADNELATLQFRDGKRRPVRASDLISGAIIANIANAAIERACVRQVETGERGLRLEDVALSIEEEFDTAIRALTPANCRQHLVDLPQDMDVVSVQPTARKGASGARLLNPSPTES